MAYLTLQYHSQALTRAVTVRALLPSDGITGAVWEPPYRAVYFLSGYSVDGTDLLTYLSLRKECELKGLAIVIVDGCNAFYVDHPERNECFQRFVGEELVDVTHRFLPLSKRREDTFLAGISMGGYGALRLGGIYRERFSKVAALSPSADAYDLLCKHPGAGFQDGVFGDVFGTREAYYAGDTNLEKLYTQTPPDALPELFLACGEDDGLVVDSVNRFAEALQRSGIPHRYLRGRGSHEYEYWQEHLDAAFSFLAGIEPGTKNRLVLGEFG